MLDLTARLEAVQEGHRNIQDDDVRLELLRRGDQRPTIGNLTDYLAFAGQEPLERRQQERVIVCEQNPWGAHGCLPLCPFLIRQSPRYSTGGAAPRLCGRISVQTQPKLIASIAAASAYSVPPRPLVSQRRRPGGPATRCAAVLAWSRRGACFVRAVSSAWADARRSRRQVAPCNPEIIGQSTGGWKPPAAVTEISIRGVAAAQMWPDSRVRRRGTDVRDIAGMGAGRREGAVDLGG